jgi:hypothetical protein
LTHDVLRDSAAPPLAIQAWRATIIPTYMMKIIVATLLLEIEKKLEIEKRLEMTR